MMLGNQLPALSFTGVPRSDLMYPNFGTINLDVSGFQILDRMQPYDYPWDRRYNNEVATGRSLLAGGSSGVYAAYQVNDSDPTKRYMVLAAQTNGSGSSFAAFGYGLECNDQDPNQLLNTNAIFKDVNSNFNIAWDSLKIQVANTTPSVPASLHIELKDFGGANYLWQSPEMKAPVSGSMEFMIPNVSGVKLMYIVLSSPPISGQANVNITKLQAKVRRGSKVLPALFPVDASLFAGGTGGTVYSNYVPDFGIPVRSHIEMAATTGVGGTCFAGAEWTVPSMSGWSGIRIFMNTTSTGLNSNVHVEVKDIGGSLLYSAPTQLSTDGNLDFDIPTIYTSSGRKLTIVFDSPATFGTSTASFLAIAPMVTQQSQIINLDDHYFTSSYAQIRRAYNPSNTYSRDNINFTSGVFDSIPATGFQCLCAALASDLGVISSTSANTIITNSVAAIVAAPRHSSGILPHWLLNGARHPNSEWSTVDTALALFSALIGAKMAGLTSQVTSIESILDGINGASLRDGNGLVTMGYDTSGNILPYTWSSYGGELVLSDLLASWTNPSGHPSSPVSSFTTPPVFNGRGFIQEIAGIIFPMFGRYSGADRHGIDWLAQRKSLQELQQRRRYNQFYGISAGEIIDYSNYETVQYFTPDLLPLSDNYGSTGPWIFPHYMSMVTDFDPAAVYHAKNMLNNGQWQVWSGPAESFINGNNSTVVHRSQISLNAFFNTVGWYYACKRRRGQTFTPSTDPLYQAAISRTKMLNTLRVWFPNL